MITMLRSLGSRFAAQASIFHGYYSASACVGPAVSRAYSSRSRQQIDTVLSDFEQDESSSATPATEKDQPPSIKPTTEKKFPSLFRNSKFMQIANPRGAIVYGEIVRVRHDDLYIDFGMKFYCVCKIPKVNAEKYVTGAFVTLRLHELELSSRFLGSEKDLTLNEAHATLLGVYEQK